MRKKRKTAKMRKRAVGRNKRQDKLEARIQDWEKIQNKAGYHKPGSLNKHKQ